MRRIELLVVEDCSADLFWLKTVLKEAGVEHVLSVVEDGARAVNFLLKQREYSQAPTPDLILLDVNLPMLTGIEVLRRVPNAAKLPICVLSSSTVERDLFRKEFGIQTYLVKPVSRDSLLWCFRFYDHLRPIAEELSGA